MHLYTSCNEIKTKKWSDTMEKGLYNIDYNMDGILNKFLVI